MQVVVDWLLFETIVSRVLIALASFERILESLNLDGTGIAAI